VKTHLSVNVTDIDGDRWAASETGWRYVSSLNEISDLFRKGHSNIL
jgi:hypothetical protein